MWRWAPCTTCSRRRRRTSNCGYLPSDIGTLRSEHLDLKKGVINRERHKSGNPQVHRLWPETLELINKHRKDIPENSLLFRSPTGLALWRDGNGDKLISKRFKEACLLAKVKLNGRNFRHLRATGANLIEQANAESPQLASQYLAHSVGGVKQHYTLPAFEPMFKALEGLRENWSSRLCDGQVPQSDWYSLAKLDVCGRKLLTIASAECRFLPTSEFSSIIAETIAQCELGSCSQVNLD